MALPADAGALFICVDRAYPFLAYENPNDSDVFIIEGWVPDYVLDRGILPVEEGRCRLLITTGGPLEVGSELSQYKTYADMTATRLVKMGFHQDQILPLPSPAVDKDRTYASALEVGDWLVEHPDIRRANLITQGPHARSVLVQRELDQSHGRPRESVGGLTMASSPCGGGGCQVLAFGVDVWFGSRRF